MKAKTVSSILILLIFTTPLLAQEIYVYPNKKHADAGLIEYRGYTLDEIDALESKDSFAPFTTLAWGPERRLTDQENAYRARVVTSGDSIFCAYSKISNDASYFIRSLDDGFNWEPFQTLVDTTRYQYQYFPEILINDSNLIIGQMVRWVGEGYNLTYYKSENYGETWGPMIDVLPYYYSNLNHFSSFCNFEQNVYASYRNHYYDSIYVVTSTNWGEDWSGLGINVA